MVRLERVMNFRAKHSHRSSWRSPNVPTSSGTTTPSPEFDLEEPDHARAEANRLGDGGEIEKIVATVLHETYGRQVEERTETLSEGTESFYG